MSEIVVDPDGTRWVSVPVSAEVMRKLESDELMDRFSKAVSIAFWTEYGKRLDRDLAGLG